MHFPLALHSIIFLYAHVTCSIFVLKVPINSIQPPNMSHWWHQEGIRPKLLSCNLTFLTRACPSLGTREYTRSKRCLIFVYCMQYGDSDSGNCYKSAEKSPC